MDAPDVADAKHLGPRASSGAKRAVGLGHGLPDEVLAEVLNFSGLREFAACAAAGSKLRGGLERLSPALKYQLVMSRFPILALMFEGAETTELPPPRELFESQLRMGISPPTRYAPTRGLDDYTFFLEVELGWATIDGRITNAETLWAGKGSLASGGSYFPTSGPGVEFNLPDDVFECFDDVWSQRGPGRRAIRVNIMAARRSSEGMQRALLGCGPPDDRDHASDSYHDGANKSVYMFYDMTYKLYTRGWHEHVSVQADRYYLPAVRGELSRGDSHAGLATGPPRFYFTFVWADPSEDREMNVEHACLALEHYFTWV